MVVIKFVILILIDFWNRKCILVRSVDYNVMVINKVVIECLIIFFDVWWIKYK